MNKVFGYATTMNGVELAVAIAKTGETLVVMPSTSQQAAVRLGMAQESVECHERYDTFFQGEPWEATFVEAADIEGHLGLQRAFKRANKRDDDSLEATKAKFAAKNSDPDYKKKHKFGVPSVEVEDE
jgi:hypothetical protein